MRGWKNRQVLSLVLTQRLPELNPGFAPPCLGVAVEESLVPHVSLLKKSFRVQHGRGNRMRQPRVLRLRVRPFPSEPDALLLVVLRLQIIIEVRPAHPNGPRHNNRRHEAVCWVARPAGFLLFGKGLLGLNLGKTKDPLGDIGGNRKRLRTGVNPYVSV